MNFQGNGHISLTNWFMVSVIVGLLGCGPLGGALHDMPGQDGGATSDDDTKQETKPLLTLDRLYSDPPLDGVSIRAVEWTKDGSKVGYLRPGAQNRDVLEMWVWEVASGTSRMLVKANDIVGTATTELSEEEILALERKRITQRGITSFVWSPDGESVLFPLGGKLYVFGLESKKATVIDDGEGGTALGPRFSPDGQLVAFVRGAEIWVVATDGATAARQITRGAGADVTRGLAEFVAMEEMGRYRGYWWNPDSTRIAFLEVDESGVEIWKRASYKAGESTMAEQRYPGAGRANAVVRPGVVNVATGAVTWIDLPDDIEYVARVDWSSDGETLSMQLQPRDQARLDLVVVDATGALRTLLTETSESFINLTDDLTFLEDGRMLWTSERTGTRQIELLGSDGKMIRQLTSHQLPVLAIEGVDENAGVVIYTSVTSNSIEKHVFTVGLDGEGQKQVSTEGGWHSVKVSKAGTHYVDTHCTATSAPRATVHDVAGKLLAVLEDNPTEELDELLTTRPEFVLLTAADGKTSLNGMFIKPPDFDPKKKYPVVMYGYGGPHGHVVADRWRRSGLFNHFLAQQGFVIFAVDPRGGNYRGKQFEDEIHKRCGVVEVADHAAAVRWLKTQKWVDGDRIGIWGWSYGGYLAIMSLLATEGLYSAAIAVAPVTDWQWYDTHYTERYMGKPDTDAEVYRAGSALEQDLSGITESLLIVHGMADDNVFLRHSLSFIEKLQEAGVQFDLMLYPGKTHLIAGKATRKHLFSMMHAYWVEHLGTVPAPSTH